MAKQTIILTLIPTCTLIILLNVLVHFISIKKSQLSLLRLKQDYNYDYFNIIFFQFIRFLSIVKHSMDGMKGVDPEDVIILLNKWDCLSNEDVEQQELIFKHMKTCLRKIWMEIDESCIFRTSARQVLTF